MFKRLSQRLINKMRKRYQVELIDHETLSQSRQFSLRPLSVAVAGITLLILVVVGTATLFIFTPTLHRLIPNYEDPIVIQARKDSLLEVVKSAEDRLEIYEAYSKGLRQVTGIEDEEMDFDSSQLLVLMQDQEALLPAGSNLSPEPRFRESEAASSAPSRIETVYVTRPSQEISSPPPVARSPRSQDEWLQKLFVPLEGEMLRGYTESGLHYGVDIVAAENTLIKAAADGFVVLSEYSDLNGWVIGVATEGDIVTFYKHNSRLLKEAGTYVYAGEPIAVIGSSGENSSGTHLHFELWYLGRPVNPVDYVAFTK